MDEVELARKFKALAEPVRLHILQMLPSTDVCEEVYNVSELAEELGLAQPTVSHHLAVLRNAGLVKSRKMCRDVYYWLEQEALSTILDDLSGRLLTDKTASSTV